MAGGVVFSDSTWQQPTPSSTTEARASVVSTVAERVTAQLPGRVMIGIDGRTGSGKTTFGHELAQVLAAQGLTVLRASLDDFKRPWADRHLYDRESGEGYFRNAFDYHALARLLFEPFTDQSPHGVALCALDPITQVDHSTTRVTVPETAVLIVDGVFAFRDEINQWWTLRVWLDVDRECSTARGIGRDRAREGDQTEALHRDRYGTAEAVYLTEADPLARADIVINNDDFGVPFIVRG